MACAAPHAKPATASAAAMHLMVDILYSLYPYGRRSQLHRVAHQLEDLVILDHAVERIRTAADRTEEHIGAAVRLAALSMRTTASWR